LKSRIDYLDGLRGIAIFLVLVFHAYSRWSNIVPYGEVYKNFPLFRQGFLGVQLFFLISGFVIFMTLDKTKNLKQFIYKRWLRLFPAMLLASTLIYFTSHFFYERPEGIPNILSLLPGITFIEPEWWSKLIGIEIKPLEGAFWSIYVEFKFYMIAGFIYFILGRKYLIPSLFVLFIFSILISYISDEVDITCINIIQRICSELSLKHFGWFTSGALFYLFYQSKKESHFFIAVGISIFSSLFVGNLTSIISVLILSGLFATSLRVVTIQRILATKILVFFGFISYPLYLLHENALVSMIVKSPSYFPWMNPFFYPVIPISILSLTSFLIAKRYEEKVRNKIEFVRKLKFNKCYGFK
jgi:peptidoglycan/LPS O-acetylase OafA/YrhL